MIIQSATSAIQPNVTVTTPKQQGAEGDCDPDTGEGTNDRAAIQSAIDLTNTSDLALYFDAGYYKIQRAAAGQTQLIVENDRTLMYSDSPRAGLYTEDSGRMLTVAHTANIEVTLNARRASYGRAIDDPTAGDLEVTCTTASDAGYFSPGVSVAVVSTTGTNDTPYILEWNTVVDSDAETGVVTLTLPLRNYFPSALSYSLCLIPTRVQNIVIRGLRFVGDPESSLNQAIFLNWAENVLIEDCLFEDVPGCCIYICNSRNVTVRRNTIINCGGHGITIGAGCIDSKVVDNYVRSVDWIGIYSDEPNLGLVIANNHIENAGWYGIMASRAQQFTIRGNAISSCGTIGTYYAGGIWIKSCRYGSIASNVILGRPIDDTHPWHDYHGICAFYDAGSGQEFYQDSYLSISGNTTTGAASGNGCMLYYPADHEAYAVHNCAVIGNVFQDGLSSNEHNVDCEIDHNVTS